MDALARDGVVAVARHIDEGRDEAVETVEAQEHAHRRPLAQPQDAVRGGEEIVLGNLEQLVARIVVEDVRQRLAVMAGRRQAGARYHVLDLAAQQRDVTGAAAVGAGGEQADEAALAGQLAVIVEGLHADIVHMDAAMHQAALVRLGDDQRRWLREEDAVICGVRVPRCKTFVPVSVRTPSPLLSTGSRRDSAPCA